MSEETNGGRGVAVSMPAGAIGGIMLLGILAAAYALLSRDGDRSLPSGSNLKRKVGLTTLIALLENDATRKVVITVLKALAKRS